jgi:hypothetical protein
MLFWLHKKKKKERHSEQRVIGDLSLLFAALVFVTTFSLAKVPVITIDPLDLSAIV